MSRSRLDFVCGVYQILHHNKSSPNDFPRWNKHTVGILNGITSISSNAQRFADADKNPRRVIEYRLGINRSELSDTKPYNLPLKKM
ncbi:hypothetical protein QTP88_004758 [Uroleucon formosanum]